MSKKEIKRQDGFFTVRFLRIFARVAHRIDKEKRYEGYMTVEASLIFPVILGFIVLLILMMFFLHTRVLMSSMMNAGVIHASGLNQDDLDDFIRKHRSSDLETERFTGNWSQDVQMKQNKNRITASMNAKMVFSVPFLFHQEESTRIQVTAIRTEPVRLIRNIRMAEKLVEDIKSEKEEPKE